MPRSLLILNSGSSSVKFAIYPATARPARADLLCEGKFEGIGGTVSFTAKKANGELLAHEAAVDASTHQEIIAQLLKWIERTFDGLEIAAAGHRVVHGGANYAEPMLIDDKIIADLTALIPLAPLHQPHNLTAINALAKLHRSLPQVACFDTAFHHNQPRIATTFAIPRALTDDGIRRYGFHGISYEYIAEVLPHVLGPELAEGRIIVAHLGNGASMCAMRERKSIATTMGFTALDGLPMGQRCGAIDPGVLLYLGEQKGMSASEISHLLYNKSGLLGVSGMSNDMRTLLASDDPHAKEAVDLFVYRICRELGSLAAALGGLDALIFTAGIGENATPIRSKVCAGASWLGIQVDEDANAQGRRCITKAASRVSVWTIPTDEDLMIARHTWDLINSH